MTIPGFGSFRSWRAPDITPNYAPFDLPNANAVTLDDAGSSLYLPLGRKVRNERLNAVRSVINVFLRHLDPGILCIGRWSPHGDFILLDMSAIASEAGLCQRRCERALLYLRKPGFVSVFSPQHYHNPILHTGLRVLRALIPAFFEWAGLAEPLEQVQSDSLQGIEADSLDHRWADSKNRFEAAQHHSISRVHKYCHPLHM